MFGIEEAAVWALAGGIAVHRNFEVDGLEIGGKTRSGTAYHVFGLREALLAWGSRNRQKPAWLQHTKEDAREGWPPHFDVFGSPARRLEQRLSIPPT
jgi:hypothetical protein